MTRIILFLPALLFCCLFALSAQERLPVWTGSEDKSPAKDWMIDPGGFEAGVYLANDGKRIVLFNGLVKRVFVLEPNVACIDYTNLSNGQQLIRSISPEARLEINGREYHVGGLYGQNQHAYFLESWLGSLFAGKQDFKFRSYTVENIFNTATTKSRYWLPPQKGVAGKKILFHYEHDSDSLKGVSVVVSYEIYDGIPLITKSLNISNNSAGTINLGKITSEILAVPEEESAVVGSVEQMKKPQGIYIESNYAFNNAMRYELSDHSTHWKADTQYTSQVNYTLQTPCLLEVYPHDVRSVTLQAGDTLQSIRSNELLMDSYDRERRGLAIRYMYRAIAPWTTGNPIFMHVISKTDQDVFTAIEQCRATGYEAVILSFGSHLEMEDTSAANLNRWKKIAEAAHKQNILIGGYSLFSSRRIDDENDVINPVTGKPGGTAFGNAPCFGSKWGLAYRDKIMKFFEATNFDIWENDGPYPGDICASTSHPGHKGAGDSQWKQVSIQKELYAWLKKRGVYMNVPDWYFLDGSNKIAIGYREVNFALPRHEQIILNRQNIYDGTWENLPSMGWGFVPLTAYHNGGDDAVLEPLRDHLYEYRQLMMQYYGAGVQACYRGPRLYDSDSTKQLVQKTISWYKKFRNILNADIIHLRRPDGRDWDGFLHVDPASQTKGFLMLFNPLDKPIKRTIRVPLYYTGLTASAKLSHEDSTPVSYKLNRDHTIDVTVNIAAREYTWYTIR